MWLYYNISSANLPPTAPKEPGAGHNPFSFPGLSGDSYNGILIFGGYFSNPLSIMRSRTESSIS